MEKFRSEELTTVMKARRMAWPCRRLKNSGLAVYCVCRLASNMQRFRVYHDSVCVYIYIYICIFHVCHDSVYIYI
jgi:hypothetical protein